MEHPGHGAGFAQVTAALGEDMSYFADGAVAIVSGDIDQQSHAARTVSFEGDLLVGRAGKLAGAALNRTLDVFRRHVLRLGGRDRDAQTRIAFRITAATISR